MLIYRYKQRFKERTNEQEKRSAEAGREERQEVKTQPENYEKMTVPELKEIAKVENIEGYSNMKKDELINALKRR